MYRSAIYCDDEAQLELAKKSAETYQQNLNARGVTGNRNYDLIQEVTQWSIRYRKLLQTLLALQRIIFVF